MASLPLHQNLTTLGFSERERMTVGLQVILTWRFFHRKCPSTNTCRACVSPAPPSLTRSWSSSFCTRSVPHSTSVKIPCIYVRLLGHECDDEGFWATWKMFALRSICDVCWRTEHQILFSFGPVTARRCDATINRVDLNLGKISLTRLVVCASDPDSLPNLEELQSALLDTDVDDDDVDQLMNLTTNLLRIALNDPGFPNPRKVGAHTHTHTDGHTHAHTDWQIRADSVIARRLQGVDCNDIFWPVSSQASLSGCDDDGGEDHGRGADGPQLLRGAADLHQGAQLQGE